MTEFESLIQQKKDIEEKIKSLRGSVVNSGRASIRPDLNRSGRWMLAIEKKYFGEKNRYTKSKTVRIGIAESMKREEVITIIPEIIKDLSALYKSCGGEEDV